MISNYFTLLHCAQALHDRCSGFKIIEAYSQEKETLCLVVYNGEQQTIKISCAGSLNYVLCKAGDVRAKKNSLDLFPQLVGKTVTRVSMHPFDRIIRIDLEDETFLEVQLFRGKANVLHYDAGGIVLDAFLNKKELAGNSREHSAAEYRTHHFPSDAECLQQLSAAEPIGKLIKKILPALGGILANEILFRNSIQETFPASELSSANRQRILDSAKDLVSSLTSLTKPKPIIYFEEHIPICFSLIPLAQFASFEIKTFASLFDGIQFFVSRAKSAKTFLEKKKEIVEWLLKEKMKAEQALSRIDEELHQASRAEEYELFGKLITNTLPLLHKGMKNVTVHNSFGSNEDVTIALDPAVPPHRNAERYFEKAKKAKSTREEQQSRKTMLQQRLHVISAILEDSNTIEESISLKNFLHLYQEQLQSLGYMTQREHEELPPFKIFSVDGGFIVYAGKNSENNDLLTMKHAKPNDLWFHSRGSSGSHVVLKVGSAKGTPSKKAIEQAASIAAYYSKMKNAKNVPVAMTEKKYVHKPKGAKPGSVLLDRETVLFVAPRLPDDTHN